MATRCTPFGLFAGCSAGNFASSSSLEVPPPEYYKRQTRYDMHFLVSFSSYLSNKKKIKDQIKFYPNSTIYKIGKRYRYVEYTYVEKRRQHSLESVVHSPYLEKILKISNKGATVETLVKKMTELGIDKPEALRFISELISNQILIGDLEPSVTGQDSLEELRLKLSELDNTEEQLVLVKGMQLRLDVIDQQLGNRINKYLSIKELFSSLGIPYELKYLFQTDLYTSLRGEKSWVFHLKESKTGNGLPEQNFDFDKKSEPRTFQGLIP